MAKDINLLPDITLNEEKEAKRQKLLAVVSMSIFAVGVVGLITAITIDLTLGKSAEKLHGENEERRKTVRSYAEVEVMQRTIKAKLATSGNIIKAAKDYKGLLENLQALLPDNGITIQSISIDKTDMITISGKANSSDNFRQYVNNILSEDKGAKFFDNVDLASVATARDGTLQFNISMNLKKAEAAQ